MDYLKIKKLLLNKWKIIGTDKLSIINQILLFKTLYELLLSGFSFRDSLNFIKAINLNSKVIDRILLSLEMGNLFSDSLLPFVDHHLCDQIKMAEKHGNMMMTLKAITEYMNLRYQQRKKLKAIIIYPIFLLMMLIFVTLGINIFVTPQLNGVVRSQSNSNYSYIIYLLLIGLLIIILLIFNYVYHQSKFKRIDLLTKLPLVGNIFRNYCGYYIASNLSLMIKSGMNINDILSLMLSFGHHSLVYKLGQELHYHLSHGEDLNIITNKHYFIPSQIPFFLSKGDSLELVAKNMEAFSKICFKKIETRSNHLIALIQPVMFILIGVMIVMTYLNILMPMYQSLKGVY